jgi:hypothetical protein
MRNFAPAIPMSAALFGVVAYMARCGGSVSGGSNTQASHSGGSGSGTPSQSSSEGGGRRRSALLPDGGCTSWEPVLVQGVSTGYETCGASVLCQPGTEACGASDGGVVARTIAIACPALIPRADVSCVPRDSGYDDSAWRIPEPVSDEGGGPPSAAPNAECVTDNDCSGADAGTGYCAAFGGGCYCVPACLKDSDCAPGSVCLCGDPAGRCVPATCVSSADCAAGQLCVQGPSYDFRCQTAQDSCHTDSECADAATVVVPPLPALDPRDGHCMYGATVCSSNPDGSASLVCQLQIQCVVLN